MIRLNHPRKKKKKRSPERINWKKRSPHSLLSDNYHIKRRPPGNHKLNTRRIPSCIPSGASTRKKTRRAEVNETHVLSRESSPCPPRRTA
ncbi:hypothetical protein TNIN_475231 [Trichonephila inaurata madagascariensis]|uniref:Uncharacterized protein n=1 Tax=Trichonephila inaurata madagascariensis TaxID=2747483 RepID=A0A8X6YLR4_9ARAC|nr:hypothetical protein TNIN_475231 [Trichonephila inaurata madagascariensis]